MRLYGLEIVSLKGWGHAAAALALYGSGMRHNSLFQFRQLRQKQQLYSTTGSVL